jgi:hypothetical protein
MRFTAAALLVALSCLAQAGREAAPVEVHEWGVLVYGDDDDMGLTLGQPGPDVAEAVRAPVVYFHGPEFTGTFTVGLPAGDFTVTVPEPDVLECDKAVWTLEGSWSAERESAARAADSALRDLPGAGRADWSEVPAMMLSTGSGELSRYLFYECTLDSEMLEPSAWTAPIQYDGRALLLPPMLSIPEAPGNPDLLIIGRSDNGPVMWHGGGRELADSGLEELDWTPYTRTDAMGVLLDWSAELLELEEVEALWDTWEAWAVRRDNPREYVVLSRLWPEKVETVSRISLETEEGHPVEYHRFLLGALVVAGDVPVRHVSPDWGEDLR